jgi:hypothetical protein
MTRNPDRDYAIAVAHLEGATVAQLAAAYGLHSRRILVIIRATVDLIWRRNGRPVPDGLPVRTAVAIEDALGIWPDDENAPEIARRRMEILRSRAGRRLVMEEIDGWLKYKSNRSNL